MTPAVAPRSLAAPGDKAMVVFIQPDGGGQTILRVFDGTGAWKGDLGGKNWFATSLAPGKQVLIATFAYQCAMCSVKIADAVMHATLAGGKTYYVLVEAEMGMWKGVAHMKAIRPGSGDQAKLPTWLRDTEYLESDLALGQAQLKVDLTAAWNIDPIPEALAEAGKQWAGYSPETKAAQTLNVDDAIDLAH